MLFKGASLEGSAHYEHDLPLDRGGAEQRYVDLRSSFEISLQQASEAFRAALGSIDLSLSATLGAFAFNPSYAARPDNSGRALLRYAGHVEWYLPAQYLVFAVDGTFFTDREQQPLTPSELDLTLTLGLRCQPFELSVAYERDLPVDRAGALQQFVFTYLAWSFSVFSSASPSVPASVPRQRVPNAQDASRGAGHRDSRSVEPASGCAR